MEWGIAVLIFIMVGIVDAQRLIQSHSFKIWAVYGGCMMGGVVLMTLSALGLSAERVFALSEHLLHPISLWMFQLS